MQDCILNIPHLYINNYHKELCKMNTKKMLCVITYAVCFFGCANGTDPNGTDPNGTDPEAKQKYRLLMQAKEAFERNKDADTAKSKKESRPKWSYDLIRK